MTTRKFLEWCNEAKKVHENSWEQECPNKPGHYNISIPEALKQTKPRDTHSYEEEMAVGVLGVFWMESGEWYEQVEERKLRNKVTR